MGGARDAGWREMTGTQSPKGGVFEAFERERDTYFIY